MAAIENKRINKLVLYGKSIVLCRNSDNVMYKVDYADGCTRKIKNVTLLFLVCLQNYLLSKLETKIGDKKELGI